MAPIDWILLIVPLLFVLGVALYANRFTRSVADFLSGGRLAGRYLLANARGEADAGLANTMSKFEIILVSGFVLNFWEKVSVPVLLLIGISGFVVYRFRETRALTLAQFFEMRYSRRFRLFMGSLAFLSGILNYGIFPAISARFFIYFLNLPLSFDVLGVSISTFAMLMFSYLSMTVVMTLVGGQVTLMVTDCVEGIFSHAVYILIVVAVFLMVGWGHIVETMSATPPGKSMINPFDAHDIDDFNIWFAIMALLTSVYTTMALQNKQGFNSAARSAHESRMGGVLGHWRGYARTLMLLALGLCVATFIRNDDFANDPRSIAAKQQIAAIEAPPPSPGAAPSIHPVGSQAWFDDKAHVPQLQRQMTAPVVLSHLLPTGAKGLFLAIMIMGLLAGDAGHLHSWGSIFVQDVLLPLRKGKPLGTSAHIWALRGGVLFVAAFAFFFSLTVSIGQYIALWWALTAGVFTGGAGAAIIGGLYWRRGTVQAAWAATLTGSTLSLVGILASQKWAWVKAPIEAVTGAQLPPRFWLNGQQAAFVAACVAVLVYVIVALVTSAGRTFDIDAMLHRPSRRPRGAVTDESSSAGGAGLPLETAQAATFLDRFRLRNILKFDSNFTRGDKWVAGGIFWWSMTLLAVNITVSILNYYRPWSTQAWANYWAVTAIGLPFVIAIVTLVWFGIGGIIDVRHFFRDLRDVRRDVTDDGRVVVKDHGHTIEVAGVGPKADAEAAKPMPRE